MQAVMLPVMERRRVSDRMQPFHVWLQEQLEIRDWRQSEFARRASVSDSLVSHWVRGTKAPGVQSAQAIADALGMPVNVVFTRLGLKPVDRVPVGLERVDGLLKTVKMTPDRVAALEATLQAWSDLDRRTPG